MALNLGELTAGLRADDGQFTRTLTRAELTMRGLTRDVNGQLRDMHGRFVNESRGMGQSLSYNLGRGARGAVTALRTVGKAAMVMAFVSAGAAVAAGGALALLPLIVIAGAAKILASNKEVAGAFSALGKHVKSELTRLAQPLVKPFVAAAAQLRKIFDEVAPHIGAAFAAVAPMIGPLVDGIGKFATGLMPGFVSAIQSAQPVIEALADGLGSIGAGLGGFFEGLSGGAGGAAAALGPFFQVIGSLLPVVGSLLGALATLGGPILAGVASALTPLIGVVQQLADWLGQLVAKIPPGVLTAIGAGFVVLALGVKAYSLAMGLAGAATRIWAGAQLIFNAVMAANPIGLVIALVVGLAAAVVIAYQKSETFRAIVQSVWTAVKNFISAAVDNIKGALAWFGTLPGRMSAWWGAAKDAAVRQASSMVSWMRGLPGRIKSALGKLGSLLVGAGKDVIKGLWNGISGMGGWLWSKVKSFVSENVVNAAKSFLHIGSPSKLMADQIGQWIPAGIAQGALANTGVIDKAMSSLVSTPTPSMAMDMGASAGAGVSGRGRGLSDLPLVRVDLGGQLGDALVGVLRDKIGVGGGDVQLYLGKRR
ncbi:hypothetical protein OHA02_17295 [Streptomyces phaeochromogenes]|nr:hypothetical protein [Streptomyces phaeochromogenes]